MLGKSKLRVARPTDNLEAVARLYKEGLGFAELHRFENHGGFDGVMLGPPDAPYHLESTKAPGSGQSANGRQSSGVLSTR